MLEAPLRPRQPLQLHALSPTRCQQALGLVLAREAAVPPFRLQWCPRHAATWHPHRGHARGSGSRRRLASGAAPLAGRGAGAAADRQALFVLLHRHRRPGGGGRAALRCTVRAAYRALGAPKRVQAGLAGHGQLLAKPAGHAPLPLLLAGVPLEGGGPHRRDQWRSVRSGSCAAGRAPGPAPRCNELRICAVVCREGEAENPLLPGEPAIASGGPDSCRWRWACSTSTTTACCTGKRARGNRASISGIGSCSTPGVAGLAAPPGALAGVRQGPNALLRAHAPGCLLACRPPPGTSSPPNCWSRLAAW